MEQVTREEYKDHESRITALERRQDVLENRVDNIDKKLDKIESNTTWILRLIIGFVILAVLGLIVKGGM